MIEIFETIDDEFKQLAEDTWNQALTYTNPINGAQFLTDTIDSYEQANEQEKADFLRFYFQLKMEMNKL